MRTEIFEHHIDIAKLFWNGKSQAVRLPKAFRFNGDEVTIRKQGADVILSPKPKARSGKKSEWDTMLSSLPDVDDDFMKDRPLNRPHKPRKIF